MDDSKFGEKLTAFQDGVYDRYMKDIDRKQVEEETRERFIEDKLTVQDLTDRLKDLPEDAVIFKDECGLHAMIGVPEIDDEEIDFREIISWGDSDDDNTDKENW